MEASEVPSNNVSSLVNTFNAPASPGYYFIIVMSEVYNTPNAEVDFNLTTYNAAGLALIGSNTNFS
jgi:hypothetical protein